MSRRVNEALNDVYHGIDDNNVLKDVMVADLAFDDKNQLVGVVDFNDKFHPLNKDQLVKFTKALEQKGRAGV